MSPFFLIGSLTALAAGAAQSSIGFGFSMIMAPIIMLVMEPAAVVPTILLVDVFNCILVTLRYRRHIHIRMVVPLTVGGIIGMAAGIQVLTRVDPDTMRLLVGLLVLVFTVVLWSGWRRPVRESLWITLPVGMASGFAGGATTMSGPPVVLFMANQGHHQDVFRANLIAYFALIEIYGIGNLWWAGALSRDIVAHAGILIPSMLLGTGLGFFLGPRIPEKAFRNLIFAVLVIVGLVLVINSLGR
ncbi:MAG TPA: sulfite exporter TauE/SafE family protein [Candidatus Hydrogenedentes bacterium]|nr:MAG: Sulfite exporter TauE/SafE [Candidatus Hydrogenedentes bacterium ADurb.Bin179]HOH28785.1 sulfite exporter TauE/SafE family protein [Candidatus Hydrogenedentota bacterium]